MPRVPKEQKVRRETEKRGKKKERRRRQELEPLHMEEVCREKKNPHGLIKSRKKVSQGKVK